MNQIAAQIENLEKALLDPGVRSDAGRVASLLSDEFVEFGSSGRIWDKAGTMAGLATEHPNPSAVRNVSDLRVRLLSDAAALVTYRFIRRATGGAEVQTLRSSVWVREGEDWRMVFHQGTLAL